MIKKTILLVTAVMIAASSATYAAKSIRVYNESDTTYYYKVGNTVKKIVSGSSKSFSLKGLKSVKIVAGLEKSGNTVKGEKRSFPKLTIAQAKADPYIQTNPVTGQNTPSVN